MAQIKVEEKEPSEYNPVEKKRRGHYTIKDDLELIRYFLERHRAGDVEAQRKQSRKLWEPLIKVKQWSRQPSAVESHFRKNIIKKLLDFDLPAKDMFLLAYHFDIALTTIEKASLQIRYECKIETNTYGVFCGAYDFEGKALHTHGLQDKGISMDVKGAPLRRRRCKLEDDTTLDIHAKRPKEEESTVDPVSLSEVSAKGVGEGTSIMEVSTESLFASFFTGIGHDNNFLNMINMDGEAINRSGPMATPKGGSSIYQRAKLALQDRLDDIVNKKMEPRNFDNLFLFERTKGCTGMIKMLKSILETIMNGTEDDLKNFDKNHGLEQQKSNTPPRSLQRTSTPAYRNIPTLAEILEEHRLEMKARDQEYLDMQKENGQVKLTLEDMKNVQDVTLGLNGRSSAVARPETSHSRENVEEHDVEDPSQGPSNVNEAEAKNKDPTTSSVVELVAGEHQNSPSDSDEELFRFLRAPEGPIIDSQCVVRAPTSDSQRPNEDNVMAYLHKLVVKTPNGFRLNRSYCGR